MKARCTEKITLKIEPETKAMLEALADLDHASMSQVIRQLVRSAYTNRIMHPEATAEGRQEFLPI